MSQKKSLTRLPVHAAVVLVLAAALTLSISAQGRENGELAEPTMTVGFVREVPEFEFQVQGRQVDDVDPDGEVLVPTGPVTPVIEEELNRPAQANALTFYRRWSASTFVPQDEDNTWAYYGSGCIWSFGGGRYWHMDVHMPEDAEIWFLRMFFYDNDPNKDAYVDFYQQDNMGGSTILASVSSSGTPGWSNAGTSFSHFVDNLNYSYTLRLDFYQSTDSNIMICGIRLAYDTSFFQASLPLVIHP